MNTQGAGGFLSSVLGAGHFAEISTECCLLL